MPPKAKKASAAKSIVADNAVEQTASVIDVTDAAEVESVVSATSSARGRKPKVVYATDAVSDLTRSVEEDENIIMKLNVKASVVSGATEKHEGVPDAYNENCSELSLFALENQNDHVGFGANGGDVNLDYQSHLQAAMLGGDVDGRESISGNNAERNLRVIHLLKDFEEKNKNNEWPATTSICCYWCCHPFSTPPFGIPVKYAGGKFHVYGCFCSLECAAAHNLNNQGIMDDVWERNQLINILSRRIGGPNIVKPAPPQLSLKMFGGYMSIDEFRDFCNTSKLININFPPMMTLTQQVEEINESDLNNDYKYIPVDTDRINKYKLKLKRTKPVTHMKNTLDNVVKVAT